MEIKFIKLSPTQNMTVLVETQVPRQLHQRVAGELMKYDGLFAEQVGFIEQPQNPAAWARLQMMGGEFCGNASMALAALVAWERDLPSGQAADAPLEVSGAEGLVKVSVITKGEGEALCSVAMPPPEKIEFMTLALEGRSYHTAVVTLPGITHIIVDVEHVEGDKDVFAERAIRQWQRDFRAEALGVVMFNRVRNFIKPLVYVHSTGGATWERGCGTGTAAVGAFLAHQAGGQIGADIAQPGGVISVMSAYDEDKRMQTVIKGRVRLVARGVAYVDVPEPENF